MQCKCDSTKSFWAVFTVLLIVAVQLQVWSAVAFAQPEEFGPFPDDTAIFVDVDNTTGIEDGSQEHPFNTIQEGINVAGIGDVVGVAPGTYAEDVILEAGVQLRSLGADTTIIDGGGSGTVLLMKDASVLDGFTVQNGAGSFGAGITTTGAPIITNNIIRNNHGMIGAAVYGNSSSPSILGNIIVGNTADEQYLSGAVAFINSSSPLIANNILRDNSGRGAINLTLPVGNTPIVTNNTIVDNSGAGIKIDARVNQSAVTVVNNILFHNTTGLKIDFGYDPANLPTFLHNDVFGNTTDYDGASDQTGINGNISADPMFIDTANDDFHLGPDSPCIDAGTNLVPILPPDDFEGDPRILDGDGDEIATVDMGMDEFTYSGPSVVEVEIDIRPASDQNPINLGSGGVVPVAILTTSEFDAGTVRPASVRFAGAAARRWSIEDVDRDGDLDLLLNFKIRELELDETSTEATLKGETFPHAGGVRIEGTDTVRIIP